MTYVFFECGGDAALSGGLFIQDIENCLGKKIDYIGVDCCERSARVFGQFFNCKSFVDFEKEESYRDCLFLPFDEHCRKKYSRVPNDARMVGVNFGIPNGSIRLVHDKSACEEYLNGALKNKSYLPKRFYSLSDALRNGLDVIVRNCNSSGSKSLKRLSSEELTDEYFFGNDYIVTEYIVGMKEYVIDFEKPFDGVLKIFPRETLFLKNGADTIVRCVGTDSKEYSCIYNACNEIVEAFKYSGVGMIQLFCEGEEVKFIEMACRVSGASYLNKKLFGWNPLASCFGCKDKTVLSSKDLYYSVKHGVIKTV